MFCINQDTQANTTSSILVLIGPHTQALILNVDWIKNNHHRSSGGEPDIVEPLGLPNAQI